MPLVELKDGSTVLFLAPGAQGDFEAQALVPEKVKIKLEEVAQRGSEVLLEAAGKVREVLSAVQPSEVELEIGISISKEGSIIIASAKAEASLKIKATWKQNAHNE
jgi:flagellar hook-basal body complex protein FliE